MASVPLFCALLTSKYAPIVDALRDEVGDAAVVRVGPVDADEPFKVLGPDELPGPPPARYVIECGLPGGLSPARVRSSWVRATEGGAAGGRTRWVDRGDLVQMRHVRLRADEHGDE